MSSQKPQKFREETREQLTRLERGQVSLKKSVNELEDAVDNLAKETTGLSTDVLRMVESLERLLKRYDA